MDPISHIALGAASTQSLAAPDTRIAAALAGGVAAIAPDLDSLIRSSTDPLLYLEFHRHFTHSLAFVPVGALICAGVLYWLVRTHLRLGQLYLFCLMGFGSHGVLDSCTAFGTLLFWPFAESRIAWAAIAFLDPLFTLPIVILVIIATVRARPQIARYAVLWGAAYLALGLIQHHRAIAAAEALAKQRDHEPTRLEALPALWSVVLWKSIYEHEDRLHIDAIRTGLQKTITVGDHLDELKLERDFPWLAESSQQALDVKRFSAIADGWIAVNPNGPEEVIDLRYSLVPNEIAPFWGISLAPNAPPSQHVGFVTFPEHATFAKGQKLLGMIF